MAKAAAIMVRVSEIEEVKELLSAAATLLSVLGERGEIKSYDREPALLARAIDRLLAPAGERDGPR